MYEWDMAILSTCYYDLKGKREEQLGPLHLQHEDPSCYPDRVVLFQHLEVQVHAEC